MAQNATAVGDAFRDLIATMARLRGAQGCPWDKEQTHASLKPFLLEETYELLEAIDRGEPGEMEEELGDLLHQIIFHCQIGAEKELFNAETVVSRLKDKLIRRHPHVFSDRDLPDSDTVLKHWAKTKAEENETKKSATSLGDPPRSMPALARAQRVGERASYVGFDWPGPDQVWEKIEEELNELKKALSSRDQRRVQEEMGDLLFTLVNLCRFFDFQAEEALSQAVDRFLRRFAHIETRIRERGRTLAETTLEEMDSLWEEAKTVERRS